MKFLRVAIKGFKEIFRDKKGLAMLLLFPLAFMLVFGYAFGAVGSGENYPHEIVIFNEDTGATIFYNNTSEARNFGSDFTDFLRNLTYEESETHVFDIVSASEAEADDMLLKREIHAICTIQANFSEAMVALINTTAKETIAMALGGALIEGKNVTAQNLTLPVVEWSGISLVVVEGDTGFVEFAITQSILRSVLDGFVREVVSTTREETIRSLPPDLKPTDWEEHDLFVSSGIQTVPGTEEFTAFDFQAPGILVFGLLIISASVATGLAREVEKKTLERLQISKMRSFDLLFGTLIPWAVIAAIQVVILLAVAIAIGFHWQGGLDGVLIALLIGIISGIASVSLGLIIAAFSKSEKHAGTLGPLIWVPLSFLSGAFFPVQARILIDVLPWGQAIESLRGILTYGLSFNDVSMNIVWMIIQTMVIFAIGVLAFSRMRLKAQ